MSENIIEKDSFSDKIKWNEEKGRFMVFRKTRTYNYDKLYQRNIGTHPIRIKEEWLELEEGLGDKAPKKEVELSIVVKRTATDTNTLKPLVAFFSQKLRISVFANYPDMYLSVCRGSVIINNLRQKTAMPLGITKGYTGIEIEKVGKEQRLTKEDVKQLLRQGTLLLEEFANGELRVLI